MVDYKNFMSLFYSLEDDEEMNISFNSGSKLTISKNDAIKFEFNDVCIEKVNEKLNYQYTCYIVLDEIYCISKTKKVI